MALHQLLFCCLLATSLCIFQAQGSKNNYLDCCEATKDVPLRNVKLLKSYVIQNPQMGCSIPAIVLITKMNRWLCYPPDSRTALGLMKALDTRNARKSRRP
nr:PREDICTED: C-C motif chemokine 21 [Anolis carolinensis]|eukprot:XP_003227988.1 PREDICTED: C-C motif chemokine 21 [Anolis carolinensis]